MNLNITNLLLTTAIINIVKTGKIIPNSIEEELGGIALFIVLSFLFNDSL